MSEVRELKPQTFDVCIIPDHLYAMDSRCPYCDSQAEHEMEEYIGGYMGVVMRGDIMKCTDCEQPFLVMESPKLLTVNHPIKVNWTITE